MMSEHQINSPLAAALARAQSKITSPPRNREVEVYSKRTNSKYKFKYATLDSIIDHVRPALTENGIWFTQTLESGGDGKYKLVTKLLHESGQEIRSDTPLLVEDGGNQAFGSALTYMRRYALTAMLGIAADEDDDGNSADGNTVESQKDRKPAKTAVPKQEEPDFKSAAEKVKQGIDACGSIDALNMYMKNAGASLEKIKASSSTAYEFLINRANNRRVEFAQAPAEEAHDEAV